MRRVNQKHELSVVIWIYFNIIDLFDATEVKIIADFLDTMTRMSLHPTITKPSRIRSRSATIVEKPNTNITGDVTTWGLFIRVAFNNSVMLQDWPKVYRQSGVVSAYGHFLDIHSSG